MSHSRRKVERGVPMPRCRIAPSGQQLAAQCQGAIFTWNTLWTGANGGQGKNGGLILAHSCEAPWLHASLPRVQLVSVAPGLHKADAGKGQMRAGDRSFCLRKLFEHAQACFFGLGLVNVGIESDVRAWHL